MRDFYEISNKVIVCNCGSRFSTIEPFLYHLDSYHNIENAKQFYSDLDKELKLNHDAEVYSKQIKSEPPNQKEFVIHPYSIDKTCATNNCIEETLPMVEKLPCFPQGGQIQCDVCLKVLSSKSLKRHMRIHLGTLIRL